MKILRTKVRGKWRWYLNVPRSLTGGRRDREFFFTETKAKARLKALMQQKAMAGEAWFQLSQASRAAVLRCLQRMEWNIECLEMAVDDWLRKNRFTDKTVRQVIEEMLQAKRKAGRRVRYLQAIGASMNRFALLFGERPIISIEPKEIDTWLTRDNWAAPTRRSYLIDVRTLFSYAKAMAYIHDSPAEKIELPQWENKAPGILTVNQCKSLLVAVASTDRGLIPFVAVQLFGGLRPEEARRLTWAEVNQYIEVTAAKAKTRRRRLVTIHPTLRAWLQFQGGLPVVNLRKRMIAVRAAAKIPWPHDCLRHSCASYLLASNKSADETAHELGHTADILYQHYRELVTPEQAAAFWALMPEALNVKPV